MPSIKKAVKKSVARFLINPIHGTLGRLIVRARVGQQWSLSPRTWEKFLDARCGTSGNFEESIDQLMQNLKRGLDRESIRQVERHVYRVIFAVLANKSGTYCVQNGWDRLMDDEEKEELKKCPPYGSTPFAHSEYLEYNHNGLIYLPDHVKKRLAGTDFIDGGAFIGDSISVLTKYDPSRIFAFEPNKTNLKKLRNNCERYGWKGVVPVNAGLGSEKSTAFMDGARSVSTQGRMNRDDESGQKRRTDESKIEIEAVDDFVRNNNVNPGLIKLDVEGMEFDVIKGARESIVRFRPVLLISIYHTPEDFFLIKPFLESLDSGYVFLVRKLAPKRPFSETMLIAYPEGNT